ncbi:hypothetical protein [Nocardioides sp. L-11A]|uniref:hypothetical protein n=1 Tax=Nocardioides sp. L-11A TaxID=3043848 RepID=UPI00249B2AFD|nr:hypothetical protein QJ852_08945 [Nocardioides sp. L-11A]
MTLGSSLRAVAATILVAATAVLLPQGAASAAACGGATGITVVVDSNQLGAGISAGCDADGGGSAASNFADAGYRIEYSQAAGMSGFVCKVNGNPSNGDCTETDAYWSLWWSDGRTGTWTYAARGVGSLKVPDGGYLAFAWHQGAGRAAPPGVAPTPRVVETKPTPAPSSGTTGTAGGSGKAGTGNGGKKKPSATKKPTPQPSASATSASPSPSAEATPSATNPTATPSDAATSAAPSEAASPGTGTDVPSIDEITDGPEATSADADGKDDGGFPAWLGIGLVVVVLGAAAAVPALRRRRG